MSSSGDGIDEVYVAGCTIVRVRVHLDEAGLVALERHVEPALTAGATVAIDMCGGGPVPVAAAAAVERLTVTASRVGARLVVVDPGQESRRTLRAAGVTDVHESLDAALGVTGPVLREAAAGSSGRPSVPSSGDATLVANQDLTSGRPNGRDGSGGAG